MNQFSHNSIIAIKENHKGVKEIHYLGFFYYSLQGVRLVEYLDFQNDLEEVLEYENRLGEVGISAYEKAFGCMMSQYIHEEVKDIETGLSKYKGDNRPADIYEQQLTMDIPEGIYFIIG